MAPHNDFEWLAVVVFVVSLVGFLWTWLATRKPRKHGDRPR